MTDKAKMIEGIESLRNFVHSLGWMDEGSEEQARDILTNLNDLTMNLSVETAKAFPELWVELFGVPIDMLTGLLDQFGINGRSQDG